MTDPADRATASASEPDRAQDGGGTPPDPPGTVDGVFGPRRELAVRYVAALADTGVRHGLIGPREVPRLWERHVLNCAVVGDLVPEGASIADVGSGAGLPGIPLAIARPDVRVVLVEPLLRRSRWLDDVVAGIGLDNVEVRRARAEALAGELTVDVVTARAVARLATLAGWCAPLLRAGGTFLALKGSSADEELTADGAALVAAGLDGATVVTVGAGVVDPPTIVVRASARHAGPRSATARARRGRDRRGGRRTAR